MPANAGHSKGAAAYMWHEDFQDGGQEGRVGGGNVSEGLVEAQAHFWLLRQAAPQVALRASARVEHPASAVIRQMKPNR